MKTKCGIFLLSIFLVFCFILYAGSIAMCQIGFGAPPLWSIPTSSGYSAITNSSQSLSNYTMTSKNKMPSYNPINTIGSGSYAYISDTYGSQGYGYPDLYNSLAFGFPSSSFGFPNFGATSFGMPSFVPSVTRAFGVDLFGPLVTQRRVNQSDSLISMWGIVFQRVHPAALHYLRTGESGLLFDD